MSPLLYYSGEPIQRGDQVRYHGERGYVEFVVTEKIGDDTLDWFVDEYPGGGAMIVAQDFGNVFLGVGELDDLEFVGRAANHP